jgi:hypothetical protein
MPKATEAARRAAALDPSLAEPHCALALTAWMYTWDRAEAEREFARAVQLIGHVRPARLVHRLPWVSQVGAKPLKQTRFTLKCRPEPVGNILQRCRLLSQL